MKLSTNWKSVSWALRLQLLYASCATIIFTAPVAADERDIVVTLQAQAPGTFVPTLRQRIISIYHIHVDRREQSEVRYFENGTEIVRTVEDCGEIGDIYGDQVQCQSTLSTEYSVGPAIRIAVTDTNGRVVVPLKKRAYRLSVNSVPTIEDSKCYWGGSVDIDRSVSSVLLPMLVYCESG